MFRKELAIVFFIFSSLLSCNEEQTKDLPLKKIYEKYEVEGSFLLKSLNDGKVYVYNKKNAQKGMVPASTFKIVSSIIGLETGIATDENYPMTWDSIPRRFNAWNQDHTLYSAFQTSCVPCYQKMVAEIGLEKVQDWVSRLQYGKMDI